MKKISVTDINQPSRKLPLFEPNLSEIVEPLTKFLKNQFENVLIEIVDCPDVSQPPFSFTGKFFGTDLKVVDVGGPGNLFPAIRADKIYDLKKICKNCESPENCFVFGPGAGPRHEIGVNCEAVMDANFVEVEEGNSKINTHTIKIEADSPKLEQTNSREFCLMANLAISSPSAQPPKVLKIVTQKRIGTLNYPESIRQFFVSYFPEAVSLAGIFLIKNGAIKVHVMPDFPESGKFETRQEFSNSWLKYFEIPTPLICATVIHSKDAEKLSLRLERTHCFNHETGKGGHYHEDTTPETIEYEGYFVPAQFLYRVDHVSGQ